MDFSFLPNRYVPLLNNLLKCKNSIWEIRIRENAPVIVRTELGDETLIHSSTNTPIRAEKTEIENILLSISGQALYRISDAMREGVVFTPTGVRIGICGKGVFSQGEIRSITEITSLCIRYPYRITNHAKSILPYLTDENQAVYSTLILSPPAGGKTTLLRDFTNCFSKTTKNVIVIDERLEFSYNIPLNVDVIREIPKDKAVLMALRTLNPDVIICDELFSQNEINALSRAQNGGVTVFSSLHATSVPSAFATFPDLKWVFKRYIYLYANEKRNFKVFDQNGMVLYEGILC